MKKWNKQIRCSETFVDMEIHNISVDLRFNNFKSNKDHKILIVYRKNNIYNLPSELNFDTNDVYFDINGNKSIFSFVNNYHIALENTDKDYYHSSSAMFNKNKELANFSRLEH